MNRQQSSIPVHHAGSWLLVALMVMVSELGAQQFAVPPGKSGYDVIWNDGWVDDYPGNRTVRVTMRSNPPRILTTDQTFTVEHHVRHYRDPSRIVSGELTIPAGKTTGIVDLYLPEPIYNFRSRNLVIRPGASESRFENSRELMSAFISQNRAGNAGQMPSLLYVNSSFESSSTQQWVCFDRQAVTVNPQTPRTSPELPAFDVYSDIFIAGNQNNNRRATGGGGFSAFDFNEEMHACLISQLPADWIGLSSVQQLFISWADFETVCQKFPLRRKSLRQWLAAGGKLVVLDLDRDRSDRWNGIVPMLMGSEKTENRRPFEPVWRSSPKVISRLNKLATDENLNSWNYRNQPHVWIARSKVATKPFRQWEPVADSQAERASVEDQGDFMMAEYLKGRIVVVFDDMKSWDADQWRQLYNAMELSGNSLQERIGLQNANSTLPYFRIPGVGDPPVGIFRVLLTLFLITAGPVMYIVLRRTRQMQFLFVLVPSLSALVCFGLILYAVMVDGFETWGSADTVTWLDQRHEMAVSHARVAYYSGANPAAHVYPMDTLVLNPVGELSRDLSIRQTGDQQVISGGDAKPRTPHQVMTVRGYDSQRQLIWSTDGGTWSVQNRLGAKVQYVIANTKDGLFFAEELADGTTQPAAKWDPTSGSQSVSIATLIEQQATSPFHRPDNRPISSLEDFAGIAWGEGTWTLRKIHELAIAEILDQPNSYIAVLESHPDLDPQLQPANYRQQVHVFIGQW